VAAWKVANGEEIWRVEDLGIVTALAVDPTGQYLLVAANRSVHLLELATGKTVRTHGPFPAPTASVAVSPNGKWYAAGGDDGTVRVWKTGEEKAAFALTGHEGPVRSVTVKDGARWLLTAGADRTVRLWDTASKKDVAVFRKHGGPVVSAAFLANGTQTISGDRDVLVLPWKIDKFLTAAPVVPPQGPPDKIPYAKD
jgi:WD40 repeat protein